MTDKQRLELLRAAKKELKLTTQGYVQWVADGVARVKARLVADPEMAKALLPNMTHAEVKAALQKPPA